MRNIDAFFGTNEWRKRIAINGKAGTEQETEYLQLYFDSVVGSRFSCKNAYPVSATHGGKPKYYLVHIADHPDADWLINDLLATVESSLYIVSCERANPYAITGFYEDEDKRRIEELRAKLGAAILSVLAQQPTRSMTFNAICLALRPRFFGQLKKGDYDKTIKQLVRSEKVKRQQEGLRAKLTPDENISLL